MKHEHEVNRLLFYSTCGQVLYIKLKSERQTVSLNLINIERRI